MNNETTNKFIQFLSDYWTIIAGGAATIAYLTEKIITYYTDNKKKKEAYHKVFTGTIKLYFSYQKHRIIYQEQAVLGMPDDIYILITKHLDSFNMDIEKFKQVIDEETHIIPEISISTYAMFDIVDRFRLIDKISTSGQPNTEITDNEKLVIRRAQFSALEEFMKEFFKDVIEEIRKQTLVSKKFTKRLFYIDSREYLQKAMKEQMNIMKRYYQSLNRQGVLPEEVFNHLIQQIEQSINDL